MVSPRSDNWPENVGILAIELYFPKRYVCQKELEKFDGVSTGKYTIGLGQEQMGFCSDNEDVHSVCLTVVANIMDKNMINPRSIGRLEVGTETIIDKSKSVKTVLMQLFEDNTDMEGCDTTNACFGGTQAVFNAINWIESSSWDGRLALVVMGDIAVYKKGPARCTGGAGALAMLIGPSAPLVFERGCRAFHVKHAYDFYKPDLTSEYATVDGKLSVKSYLSALDVCYERYNNKVKQMHGMDRKLDDFFAIIFHSPYSKLVQKSLARLSFHDFMRFPKERLKNETLEVYQSLPLSELYFDKDFEKACMTYGAQRFNEKTSDSLKYARRIGNMYTPSLYGGLCAILSNYSAESLKDKSILLFSYGSGLAASMYSIRFRDEIDQIRKLQLTVQDASIRLEQRLKATPEQFTEALNMREKLLGKAPYDPEFPQSDDLFPGTYYLSSIDNMYRRYYERTSKELPIVKNGPTYCV